MVKAHIAMVGVGRVRERALPTLRNTNPSPCWNISYILIRRILRLTLFWRSRKSQMICPENALMSAIYLQIGEKPRPLLSSRGWEMNLYNAENTACS